jgi:hypothetical protein
MLEKLRCVKSALKRIISFDAERGAFLRDWESGVHQSVESIRLPHDLTQIRFDMRSRKYYIPRACTRVRVLQKKISMSLDLQRV